MTVADSPQYDAPDTTLDAGDPDHPRRLDQGVELGHARHRLEDHLLRGRVGGRHDRNTGPTAAAMTSAMSAATAAAVGPAPAPGPWMKIRPIFLPWMNSAFSAPAAPDSGWSSGASAGCTLT